MRILAIETSGAGGSVALSDAGDIDTRSVDAARDQTSRILPLIDELIVGAGIGPGDLDLIAFGRGPGSFTGLRVAAAIAQGLGLATGVPLVAISSMAGLALQASRASGADSVLVCLDARMDEVYHGHYIVEDGLPRQARDEAIGPPSAVAPPPAGFAGVGDAFARYAEALAAVAALAASITTAIEPRATDLIALAAAEHVAGRHVAPVDALPVYLRDSTAWRRQ